MLISSVAEVISIGAIFPFLTIITSPESVLKILNASSVVEYVGILNLEQAQLYVTLGFVGAILLAAILRLSLIFFSTKFSFSAGSDISLQIFKNTLHQPYLIHLSRNSSEIISGIIEKSNTVTSSLNAILSLVTSVLTAIVIIVVLLSISPSITSIAFVVFAGIYLVIITIVKGTLLRNGRIISSQSTKIVQILQEGLGGIREVIIDNSQQVYCEVFKKSDKLMRRAQAENIFIGASPKFIMESVGLIFMATVAYLITLSEGGVKDAIPILGVFALGAQRLLPLFQQIYGSWSVIKGSTGSLEDVEFLLKGSSRLNESYSDKFVAITFKKQIFISGVCFKYYETGPQILQNISITINKGDRVGIIGKSGSGKSTFLDILMGLLRPQSGVIRIDDVDLVENNLKNWRKEIAHVSQSIFLSDATIMENIAFGIPAEEIEIDKVYDAAKKARISDLIEGWDNGYLTIVGERGVRLSGGQRQRIGIARALYKNASLLIFDEATSALDIVTESEVMEAIDFLNKSITIILVTHRETILKNCNRIYRINNEGMVCAT